MRFLYNRRDLLLVLLFALLWSAIAFKLFQVQDRSLFTNAENTWFQGDLSRVFGNMTDRMSTGHYRVKVHPLHSLETQPPTWVLIKLGLNPYRSVQLVCAAFAAIWFALMFHVCRKLGCGRIDAVLFSSLGMSSAASMFWMSVPESYALGSISILVSLGLAAQADPARTRTWAHVANNAFSMSVTITNWMVGLLTALTTRGWRHTVKVALLAIAVVTLLWGVQKFAFPHAVFFIGDREESKYMQVMDLQRVAAVAAGFFMHTMVAPAVQIAGDNGAGWNLLSVQSSALGSSGLVGIAASLAWVLLLAAGAWSLFQSSTPKAFRLTLALSIVGQFALHVRYGEETFLYSLHFLPLLVCMAATTSATAMRKPAIALAAICMCLAVTNNWQQFKRASSLAVSPRTEVKSTMAKRPDASWPRGQGHIVLAQPGSLEQAKAYHEPGGAFSPSPGSFGLSVWTFDALGKVLSTADTLPLKDVAQSFEWPADQPVPNLRTSTPYYTTIWQFAGAQQWRMAFQPKGDATNRSTLMLRSVGPAGGAVRDLDWNGERLLVNGRWSVRFTPQPKSVGLGSEDSDTWPVGSDSVPRSFSQTGWSFARIDLNVDKGSVDVLVEDLVKPDDAWYHLPATPQPMRAATALSLPEVRFAQSLDAQIAHLTMGLVRDETRPGEPTNYPLQWQRDGAYVVVALARAGQLEIAKRLAKNLAEKDFFGGFGPEADAPGLGIWSLTEVANAVGDPSFDNWLWPHIKRKAEYIERMLHTRSRIVELLTPPVVPSVVNDPELRLVAEPARDGLIVGRMDHQRPSLFINAISYRALQDAAAMAKRLRRAPEAQRWQDEAVSLKRAWGSALLKPEHDNDRTYISALWPSRVGADSKQTLREKMLQRWHQRRTASGDFAVRPLWTYFEIAEAHQWLLLQDRDRTWSTVKWFWDHQSSPGLFTWWEGRAEENSFGQWASIRGWVNPEGVTPHYWTAAEMALLQMDMLVLQDPDDHETLVIGAGVPDAWIKSQMVVRSQRVSTHLVSWEWADGAMAVSVKGPSRPKLRLGPAFPLGTTVKVAYSQ